MQQQSLDQMWGRRQQKYSDEQVLLFLHVLRKATYGQRYCHVRRLVFTAYELKLANNKMKTPIPDFSSFVAHLCLLKHLSALGDESLLFTPLLFPLLSSSLLSSPLLSDLTIVQTPLEI